MRKDIAKVVLERAKSQRTWADPMKVRLARQLKYDPDEEYDDQPAHLPTGKRLHALAHGKLKHSNQVRGPLKHFLHSNVGRPWNEIYQEACARLDRRKATSQKVLFYLEVQVAQNVYFEGGKVLARGHWGIQEVRGFYVDPRSGCLCTATGKAVRASR